MNEGLGLVLHLAELQLPAQQLANCAAQLYIKAHVYIVALVAHGEVIGVQTHNQAALGNLPQLGQRLGILAEISEPRVIKPASLQVCDSAAGSKHLQSRFHVIGNGIIGAEADGVLAFCQSIDLFICTACFATAAQGKHHAQGQNKRNHSLHLTHLLIHNSTDIAYMTLVVFSSRNLLIQTMNLRFWFRGE